MADITRPIPRGIFLKPTKEYFSEAVIHKIYLTALENAHSENYQLTFSTWIPTN